MYDVYVTCMSDVSVCVCVYGTTSGYRVVEKQDRASLKMRCLTEHTHKSKVHFTIFTRVPQQILCCYETVHESYMYLVQELAV